MAGDDTAKTWTINEPVVTQWYDREERRLRYLGFHCPEAWRSHLTLTIDLAISGSKREAAFWFRLPVRVKRTTKFYVYFVVEQDMFDADGEDQALNFRQQPTVPSPVQLAFNASSVCTSGKDLVCLGFNLKKPGIVVMPKAPLGPFESSTVNQEVLLALKSLSQATNFSAYVPRGSLSDSRLKTLCSMVQHGDLQSRPYDRSTLYHGAGSDVNAWDNFVLPSGPAATAPSPGEKQATVTDAQEETVVESVEKDGPANVDGKDEVRVNEDSVFPSLSASRPPTRVVQSFCAPLINTPRTRIRFLSADPSCQRTPDGRYTAPTSLQPLPEPDLIPPPAYKRTRPAVDDDDDDDPSDHELETTAVPKTDRRTHGSRSIGNNSWPRKRARVERGSSSSESSTRRATASSHTQPSASSPYAFFPEPRPLPRALRSPHACVSGLAAALRGQRQTLLRVMINWFKWAWLMDRRAHVALAHPHLCDLGRCARAGDTAGFYRARAACSARVCSTDEREAQTQRPETVEQLLAELEEFVLWMAYVAPEAEKGMAKELRNLGRLARSGDADAFEHAQAVYGAFVLFWFGS